MEVLIAIWAFVLLRILASIMLAAAARSTRDDRRGPERADPCLEPVWGPPPRPSREAVLATELVGGTMDRERYHAEMAVLAAEEERLHPLVLPPG